VATTTPSASPAGNGRGADASVLLRTEDLTRQFGGLTAVNKVSVAIRRGEIRAIIGPNGAGKSTFFNCLTGVIRPTSGRILFDGEDITGLPPHRISQKAIARSYQITNILPGATVLENVRIAVQSRHHSWSLLRHHRSFRDIIERARAVLASDYGSGTAGPAAIDALRRVARHGVPVCVDSRYNLRAFDGLTMVKPNEVELEAASGVPLSEPGALERAARTLLKRVDCEVLLVTRGRNGMSVFRKGLPPVHIAAHGSQDAVDVTGAGDTVAATFSAGLAAGGDPVSAARLANVAGALVVKKPGTATVSREELAAELLRP